MQSEDKAVDSTTAPSSQMTIGSKRKQCFFSNIIEIRILNNFYYIGNADLDDRHFNGDAGVSTEIQRMAGDKFD